eukprot:9675111-Alexandrium_andersonii.AAC.1
MHPRSRSLARLNARKRAHTGAHSLALAQPSKRESMHARACAHRRPHAHADNGAHTHTRSCSFVPSPVHHRLPFGLVPPLGRHARKA